MVDIPYNKEGSCYYYYYLYFTGGETEALLGEHSDMDLSFMIP